MKTGQMGNGECGMGNTSVGNALRGVPEPTQDVECGMGNDSWRGDMPALTTEPSLPAVAGPLATPSDDPRVIAAVEDYLRQCEAGTLPDVEAFVAERPEIAPLLRQCLAGLEFVQAAVPEIEASADGLDRLALAESLIGQPLGDYRIIRELGRGGMGVVYEAEQISLGRRVALKVLPLAGVLSAVQLKRFKNEARAAALLEHPNIVSVYSVGCERSVHFYAMRLIEGQSLAAAIEAMRLAVAGTATPECGMNECGMRNDSVGNGLRAVPESPNDVDLALSPIPNSHSPFAETSAINALSTLRTERPRDFYRRAAEIGVQIAEALQHAHDHGILHRDVKPGNILLDHEGKAWITDFGLARLEADASMTATGDLVGTLRYMSPEQAAGKSAVLDHRTDIYSLGITFYELLTLQPAFTGDDRHELLHKIASTDPRRPRQVNPRIPVDLETIILKAIEKDPADRYLTAQQLAADLRQLLEDKPIKARPPNLIGRAARWSRRHRGLVVACTVLLAVAAVLATIAVVLLAIERDQTIAALDEANRQRQLAVAAQERAETGLALARTAVDDMYTRVASVWLAKETAASGIQIDFMRRALAAYDKLAALPASDAASRRDAAIALQRVGELKHFLGQKREAAEALQRSIDLLKVDEDDVAAREETLAALAMSHRKLSQVQLALAEWNHAEESYTAGSRYAESLVDRKDARLEHRWELAQLRILGAELAILSGRLEEAETLARTASEEVLSIIKAQGGGNLRGDLALDWHHAGLRADVLLIDVTRRLGRLTEAEKEAKQMLAAINRGQWGALYDARELLQVEAEVHDQLASVKIALGETEAAIVHLRETLRLKQQNLRAKQRPFLFHVESFIGKRGAEEDNEPVPFCSFAETQLRLGILLQSVGRPYEAERLIGEAVFTGFMLCDAEPGPDFRYMLLFANALSGAADWSDTSGSEDAEPLRVAADTVCRAIAAYFPQTGEDTTLPAQVRDRIRWWREHGAAQLPRQKLDAYRNLGPTWKTTFYQHVLWFAFNHYTPATWDSHEGSQIRAGGRIDDCLHIAMAHHRLGNKEDARVWLDYGTKMMGDNAHIELVELREEAEALLRGQSETGEPKTERPD
jgi:serine/threonine protein kinase